jgi:parvulin-like peptidyl-prolyl isomerase
MSHRRRDTLPKNRKGGAGATASQRRISRRERENRQRRQLYIGLAIAAVLSVVIIAGFALNEYFIKPRAVLASVNGVEIRRRDYWKVRSVDLINQVNQYNQFAQLVDASQQQQYLTLAQQAASELDTVWGSTSIDDATLTRMVDDQIYLQSLDEFGLSVSDQDVQNYLHAQFQPSNAPIFTPTPEPTLIPQRAEWATQTEIALEAEEGTVTPAASDGSPIGEAGTPVSSQGTPLASPIDSGTPVGSPIAATPIGSPNSGTPNASPVSGTPDASPNSGTPESLASPIAQETSTVADAATPNPTEAIQTAEAGYDNYRDAVFDIAHLSQSDYVNLIVEPAVARDKIEAELLKDVGQSSAQVHAAHILVDTKDLADSIYAELQGGADFEDTAREQSNDTATAPNGGDLGWFTKGQMVQQFEEVAFSLQPGQISEPFQTQYGWHILTVYESDPNRAMTDQQLQQYRDSIVSRWLDQRKAEVDISSKVEPTPTPALSSFVPPSGAPPLPTETLEPTLPAGDQASPVANAATPVGSPGASPVASPIGSPIGLPVASPQGSPTGLASPSPAS